jgi:hypothetical protein
MGTLLRSFDDHLHQLGAVEFHLPPTFPESVRRVEAHEGRAVLTVAAWGAFTIGVSCDDGRTTLELDLSQDANFPPLFRER